MAEQTESTQGGPGPAVNGPRLAVEGVKAGYGKRGVLHDVSLEVAHGEIVTVLGHNGAGKTTLLKSVFGMLPLRAGRVVFEGTDMTGTGTPAAVRAGMSFTPAEAPIFRELTVHANLELGAFTVTDSDLRQQRLERVEHLFPLLKERSTQVAGTLSGGQQRMLSIGIALMSGAKLMLLDEPSLGIAPGVVQALFAQIRRLSIEEGLSVLLIEQNVSASLPIADRCYVMRMGQIILEETGDESRAREDWWDLF